MSGRAEMIGRLIKDQLFQLQVRNRNSAHRYGMKCMHNDGLIANHYRKENHQIIKVIFFWKGKAHFACVH